MTTQTLTQKVQQLEKRMERVETRMHNSLTAPNGQAHKPMNGLRRLSGIWAKKPRTKRNLAAVRKQLWNK